MSLAGVSAEALRAEDERCQARIDEAYWAYTRTARGKPPILVVPECYARRREIAGELRRRRLMAEADPADALRGVVRGINESEDYRDAWGYEAQWADLAPELLAVVEVARDWDEHPDDCGFHHGFKCTCGCHDMQRVLAVLDERVLAEA